MSLLEKGEAAKLQLSIAFDNSISIPAKTLLRCCQMVLSRHDVPPEHSPFVPPREQKAPSVPHSFPGPAAMVTAAAFGDLKGRTIPSMYCGGVTSS